MTLKFWEWMQNPPMPKEGQYDFIFLDMGMCVWIPREALPEEKGADDEGQE